MKRVFFFLLLLASLSLSAQNISVEGAQSGVWGVDTVKVVGNVKVTDTLRIMPGTVVLFEGFYGILVGNNASLIAQGAVDDSIVFTVSDTTSLFEYNNNRGAWNGIECSKALHLKLDYCVFQYAKASDTLDMSGGAIKAMLSDDIEINHCAFRHNFSRENGGAISAVLSSVKMSDCVITNNKVFSEDNLFYRYGGALHFLKCDVEMSDMDFHDNDGSVCVGGALSLDSCSLILDRAVFHHNLGLNGGGLYLMRCNDKRCVLSNLLFHDNVSGHFAGGLAFCAASPDVYNMTVTGNASIGVSCNAIFFYQESSPRLYNSIIYGNYPSIDSTFEQDFAQMWMWTYEGYGPKFYNCLIEGGTSQIHSPEYIQLLEEVIDADPLFVDPEHHDYQLSASSPCRDAGCVSTPDDVLAGLDLAGQPRLSNGRVDIGAYEYSVVKADETATVLDGPRVIGVPLSSQSRLMLDLDASFEVTVSVYSLQGQRLASRRFGSCGTGKNMLDLGGLSEELCPGVYLLEVCAGDNRWTLKTVR